MPPGIRMPASSSDKAFFPLVLAFVAVGISSTIIAVALPEITAEFDKGTAEASVLFMCWGLGLIAGSVLGWLLSDAFGSQGALATIGIVGCILLSRLAGEADFLMFQLWTVLLSAAAGSVITVGHSIVGTMERRSRVPTLAIMDFAFSLGALSSPLLVNYFQSEPGFADLDWRGVFTLSIYIWLAFALMALFLPTAEVVPDGSGAPVRKPGQRSALRALMREPAFTLFVLIGFVGHGVEYGHSYWFVTYADSLPDISATRARELLVAFLLGMVVSRLILGWLAQILPTSTILAVSASLTVCMVTFVPTYMDDHSLYTVNLILGVALGGVVPATLGLAMRLFDGRGAMLSGTGLISGTVGAQATAMIISYVVDDYSISVLYGVLSVSSVALLLLILVYVRICLRKNAEDLLCRPVAGNPSALPKGQGETHWS